MNEFHKYTITAYVIKQKQTRQNKTMNTPMGYFMIVIISIKRTNARRLAMANVCGASNDWLFCHGEITG